MTRDYTNRYGSKYTFTLKEDGNVLWEGDFKYCRIGYPNDYSKAYKQWHGDFPETEMLSFEDFKQVVHQYDEEKNKYKYYKYLMLVESLPNEIDMVDASGGPYIGRGYPLNSFGFKGIKVKDFKRVDSGYLIITEKI